VIEAVALNAFISIGYRTIIVVVIIVIAIIVIVSDYVEMTLYKNNFI